MKAPHVVFQHIVQYSSVRSASPKKTFSDSRLQHWFSRLFQWLMVDERIEVTQTCDRASNHYYQIYDRLSGQTRSFLSEEDAIVWLDQGRF